MSLIKSVSGIRGTIDKYDAEGLSSTEIKKCIDQFSIWLLKYSQNNNRDLTVIIGRDARTTGQKISSLIKSRLLAFNLNIIDLGLTTTPSVQMAIISEKCLGGIMISASHNPINWNGLKLLNSKGEFLSKKESLLVFGLSLKHHNSIHIFKNNRSFSQFLDYKKKHIESILDLVDVEVEKIKKRKFKVVVDGINSSGGIYVPFLLNQLGVEVIQLNCEPSGEFAHDPEPISKNLVELSNKVKESESDLGIAVDPDVDRLVLVCEDGSFFGEEYTITSIAKYILSKYPNSSVVSNLSTTVAVKHVAEELGCSYFESPVGEINVVQLMKEKKSIIGGEGSGGVIFSLSHYGRDALVGIALFLSYISVLKLSVTALRNSLPQYYMLKEKLLIPNYKQFDFDCFIHDQVKKSIDNNQKVSLIDGIKIYYNDNSWAHIRISNTEPVIRLIIESKSDSKNLEIKKTLINRINNYFK